MQSTGKDCWSITVDATQLEFACTDGSGSWDKPAQGGNYRISGAGCYEVRSGCITVSVASDEATNDEHPTVSRSSVDAALSGCQSSASLFRSTSRSILGPLQDDGGELQRKGSSTLLTRRHSRMLTDVIKMKYHTTWSKAFWHGSKDAGAWTELPGVQWESNGAGVMSLEISAATLEFVCHDGAGAWDKAAGGMNYTIEAPGEYVLRNGQIKRSLPPPRPPCLAVVGGTGPASVELAWNPPDVEEGVAGYRVYQEDTTEQVAEASANQRSCTISGLKGSTTYTFYISTLNEDGVESDKIVVEATTHAPGKPGPPTFLQATSHGSDHVALSWAPPRDIGGASVTAYNVFRDGQAVDCVVSRDAETGEDQTVINWRDLQVVAGTAYKYTVSAMHLPNRTPSHSDLLDLLKRKASNSLLGVSPEDNEGPRCEEIQVSAVIPIKMPKLGEKVTRIMLQGFNWWSCDNKRGWYNVLSSMVPQFEEAGFNMIWLPPPCKSADKRGYLPCEWYTLDSKYGTKEELNALGQALCSAGICPILDVVVNHRCASKKDDKGRWTVFEKPAWGTWAVCGNDQSGFGEGAKSTGELIEYAPDIDHTNTQVQRDVKEWITWMMSEVGIRALRLDFVIGFAPRIQEQYVRGADSPFAVAEYWHGDINVLRNYINATKGAVAVFDFPVYYTLKHCVHSNDFSGLRCDGKPPGIMGLDPVRCCSFVENHDTDHLEIVGGPFGDNAQIVRGYVYILTHPGTPCVFWSDWSDRGQDVRQQINRCVQLRHQVQVHCLSRCSIDKAEGGLYAAYVDGMKGGLAVKLGSRDWSPNGNWKVATYGHDYCVWRRD